jgi:hypothetical protein
MRCLPALRVTIALAALFPLHLCVADMPAITAEKQNSPALPTRAADDQQAGSPAPATASLQVVNLNIIDQKLALSLAVDTWGQIAAEEAALPLIQSESLKKDLHARLESQRAFLARLETLTGGRCGDAIKDAVDEIARDAKAETATAVRFRPLALQKNATAMIVRIRVEILQRYTGLINQQLAAGKEADFDRYFLRSDLLHQMQMVAMLHVFAGQASADFAEVIRSAAVLAEEQLAASQQVLSQMETPPPENQPAVVPLAETAATQ